LLSCSRDIFDSPDAVQKGFAPRLNKLASSERSPSPRRTAIAWRGVRRVSIDRTPDGCGVVALNGCTSTPRTGCAYTRFLRFDSVWGPLIAVELGNPDRACRRSAQEKIETSRIGPAFAFCGTSWVDTSVTGRLLLATARSSLLA
jgi:hypothetical protein